MTRRKARERALQFLFRLDFDSDNPAESLAAFWKETGATGKGRLFCEELITGVIENRENLDARLQTYAEHWDVNRMGVVDRNILRLALFEMFFRPDIPPVVSINEAIDIAKRFGSSESGRFVNAILDRAKDDLCRPIREPL